MLAESVVDIAGMGTVYLPPPSRPSTRKSVVMMANTLSVSLAGTERAIIQASPPPASK